MHAKNTETPQPRIPPEDNTYVAAAPVGTFAEGQSVDGSFAVVSGAEIGSFASGQAEDETREDV
jgi:hypothetical protein